ncbi:MAG TPA: hypothetical protein VGE74_24175 [Gemmata sp.]
MYQVHWTDAARAELRATWNAALPGNAPLLIWAVTDIAFRLERDPNNEGESRPQNTRVTFSYPLAVLFHIPTDAAVWIHSVWRHG